MTATAVQEPPAAAPGVRHSVLAVARRRAGPGDGLPDDRPDRRDRRRDPQGDRGRLLPDALDEPDLGHRDPLRDLPRDVGDGAGSGPGRRSRSAWPSSRWATALCGASVDIPSMAAARLVEGIGKGMVIGLYRSTLYRQFDRAVLVAVGIYGVIAYSTRPLTPLVTAYVNDLLSWRWIYWVNVPGRVARPRPRPPDLPPGPAAEAAAAADRLARRDAVRGLGVVPAVHVRLVQTVGRLDIERVHRDRDTLRRPAVRRCSSGPPRACRRTSTCAGWSASGATCWRCACGCSCWLTSRRSWR